MKNFSVVGQVTYRLTQVHTLVYRMGDEADDLLSSFGLSDADKKKYDKALEKFEGHFVQRKNVIFERAKFNKRNLKRGSPVSPPLGSDPFMTWLLIGGGPCMARWYHLLTSQ